MLKSAHSGTIRSLQYSDNDRLLLSASDDKLCKLWDVSNPSVSPKFKLSLKGHHNWIRKAVITSDGTIACSVSDDKTWRLWDVCSGGVEIDRRRGEEDDHKHHDSSSTLRCVALRPPAGTSIAIGDSKGGLRVYDTRSRRKIFESTSDSYVYSHREAITDVQWHPAGDFLATTSADGSTKIWDFRDQRCAWTLKAHEGSVNCAAFTADGSIFACGGNDGIVTLWKSGFNRSFENVILAEKQRHDEEEENTFRSKKARNTAVTSTSSYSSGRPLSTNTKILSTSTPTFQYEHFVDGEKNPTFLFVCGIRWGPRPNLETRRRPARCVDPNLSVSRGASEYDRRLLAEDYQERIFSHLERQVKRDV